jgi:hypothetical protein
MDFVVLPKPWSSTTVSGFSSGKTGLVKLLIQKSNPVNREIFIYIGAYMAIYFSEKNYNICQKICYSKCPNIMV